MTTQKHLGFVEEKRKKSREEREVLNGAIIHGPFSTEFNHYIDINTQVMIGRKIIPVRTEYSISPSGASVAGQIDLLAKYIDTDVYIIFDWKRTKALKERLSQCGPLSPLCSPR